MKVKTELNVSNNKITSVAEPTTSTDVATKQYVDNNSGGTATAISPLLLIGA